MIHILIVDDDQSTRTALRIVLEQDERHIDEADNGTQALNAILNSPPDIVFTDYMMLGLSGIDLIKETLTRHIAPEPSFVFVSATRRFDAEVYCLPTTYPMRILHKPFGVTNVLLVMETVLRERERLADA